MARRQTLTDKGVAALRPRAKRYAVSDPAVPGHWIRVQPSGSKSYVAIAADPRGRQVWSTIGAVGLLSLDEAREQARNVIKAIKAGADRAGPQSFAAVAEQWLKRHVDAKGLRTAAPITARTRQSRPAPVGRPRIHFDQAAATSPRSSTASRTTPVRRLPTCVLSIVRNWPTGTPPATTITPHQSSVACVAPTPKRVRAHVS